MAEVKSFFLLFSVIISMELSFSARIAGLSGTSSGSHYFTIKKVMEELFSRGHEVRVSFFHISCGPNCSKYILETSAYRLLKVIFHLGECSLLRNCKTLHLKRRFLWRASKISDLVTRRFGRQRKNMAITPRHKIFAPTNFSFSVLTLFVGFRAKGPRLNS